MGIEDALKKKLGDNYVAPTTTEVFIEEDKKKDFTYGSDANDDITENGNKFPISDKPKPKNLSPIFGTVTPKKNKKKLETVRPGFRLPASTLLNPNKDYSQVREESKGFWHSMVGEDFEFGRYIERGLGKSTINLAMQYYSEGETGIDYREAFGVEPEDTGILERFIETGAGIVADLPPFLLGAIPGSVVGGPVAGAGAGAFLNETIKTMYLEALERGDVDTFAEWWEIFTDEALIEGIKSGATLAATVAAPGLLAKTGASFFGMNTLSQVATMNTLGVVLNGHMPTKESLINDTLTFGMFNINGSGLKLARKLGIREEGQIQGRGNLQKILETKILPKLQFRQGIFSLNSQLGPGLKPVVQYGPQPQTLGLIKTTLKDITKKLNETPKTQEAFLKRVNVSENTTYMVGNIRFGATGKSIMEKVTGKKQHFVDEMINKLYPVREIVENAIKVAETKSGTKTPGMGKLNPYEMTRGLVGAFQRASGFFDRATMKFGSLDAAGKSLNSIFDPLQYTFVKRTGELDIKRAFGITTKKVAREPDVVAKNMVELNSYLIAKRILEKYNLSSVAEKKGYNAERLANAKKTIEEHKGKYEVYAKELREYNKQLLDYVEASGMLSKKARKIIEEANKDYVPFNVVAEMGMARATTKGAEGLKKWTKDNFEYGLEMEPPTNSMYKNTLHLITLADRNKALQYFFDIALKNPELMPEAKFINRTKTGRMTKEDLDTLHLSEFTKIKNQEVSLESFKPDGFFQNLDAGIPKGNQNISYYIKGEKYTFSVEPRLYRALAQTNTMSTNMLHKAMRPFTRALRTGATVTPEFFIANLVRDAYASAAISRNYHIPFVNSIKGAAAMFDDYLLRQKGGTGNEYVRKYLAAGGGVANFLEMNRNYLDPKMITEFQSGRKFINQVPDNMIAPVMDILKRVGSFGENMARVGEFKITLDKLSKYQNEGLGKSLWDRLDYKAGYRSKHGMTQREMIERAGFEARDLIDFAKSGWTAESYNQLSAFFNARIRGYDKLAEGFSKRPMKTFGYYFTMVTLPSMGLFFLNKDDEAYQALGRFEKDLFWNIPLHKVPLIGTEEKVFLKIPKPWEPGLLFGTAVERFLEEMYNDEPDALNDFLIDMAKTQMRSGLITAPTAAQPFIENLTNFNFYSGGPLVSSSKQALLPQYQYREDSSEISKWLSKQLPFGPYSPIKLDNFVAKWTGGLGKNIMRMTNSLIKGVDPEQDVFDIWDDDWIKNVNQIPIIKAFFVRSPKGQSSHITKFYNDFKKTEQAYRTKIQLEKEFKFEELQDFMLNNEDWLIWDATNKGAQTLADLRKTLTTIYNAPDDAMSDNDKRDRLDQLYLVMSQVAQRQNQIIKLIKKKAAEKLKEARKQRALIN